MVHPYYQRDKLSRVFSADALASLRMGGGEEDTIVETLCFDFEPGASLASGAGLLGLLLGLLGPLGPLLGPLLGPPLLCMALRGSAWF